MNIRRYTKLHLIACAFLLSFMVSQAMAAKIIKNALGMSFVEIPAGDFMMGTPDLVEAQMEFPDPDDDTAADELPAHKVVFKQSFFMGQTEVTQEQWFKVMENRPGKTWQEPQWQKLPVGGISWYMAQRFTEELTLLDKKYRYRLPTEAEWEYAARAGRQSEMRPHELEKMTEYAWFIDSSGDHAHPVATTKPNAYGLYDMFGNVWEWTNDWYHEATYANRPTNINPQGPAKGFAKVKRGGSYHCPGHLIRSAHRGGNRPNQGFVVDGFRVVAELK